MDVGDSEEREGNKRMGQNALLEYRRIDDLLNNTWVLHENLEDGIMIINREYEIIRANKSSLSIFNKKIPEEILGKKCFCMFDHNKTICSNCSVERIFKEGVLSQQVIRHEAYGKRIILKETSFPLIDEKGDISHALVYIKDRTHEVFLEDQLRNSNGLIGIGKLATGIAHELRNPLGNITAAAQFYLSKSKIDDEIKKYLKIILRNSERMDKVIKDLLNLAKPHEVAFTIGSVDKVIDNVCGLVRARLLKQHIQLLKRFAKDLPKVLLDEKLMGEVFLNLILNAIESMPTNGKLTITTHTEYYSDVVIITITDMGIGISEENLIKIFEPFFTTKKDGTGLGLALVQRIIRLHKGNIEVKSKPSYGTEVKIILPLYKEFKGGSV